MSSEITNQIPKMTIRDFPFYEIASSSSEKIESLLNFKPDNDDTILCSYPMGLMLEITTPIWKLQNPYSYMPSRGLFECYSCPLLDYYGVSGMTYGIQPRLLRINLPYHLTLRNEKTKFLYVVRNPEDTILGSFGYAREITGRELCFNEYFDDFLAGRLPYGDFFDHVLSWYQHKDDPNVLLVSHENMLLNGRDEITKIAQFLGLSLDRMKHDKDFFESNFCTEESDNMEVVEYDASGSSPITDETTDNSESEDSPKSSEGASSDTRTELSTRQRAMLKKKTTEKFGKTDILLMWTNAEDE